MSEREREPEGWDLDDDVIVHPPLDETAKWLLGATDWCSTCGLRAWTDTERQLASLLCENTAFMLRPAFCGCGPDGFEDEPEPRSMVRQRCD